MRFFGRRCWALVLSLALLFSVAVPGAVSGAGPDLGRQGSITVQLQSGAEGHAPIAGASLSLYKVATVKSSGGQLVYTYTAEFASCGHSLADLNANLLPEHLMAWADKQSLSPLSTKTTDASGNAVFGSLDMALYLVRQNGSVSGYGAMDPFLVALPMTNKAGTDWDYDVTAQPKAPVLPDPPGPGPSPDPDPDPKPDPNPKPDPDPKPIDPADPSQNRKRLRVEKVWSDGPAGHQPVTVGLYRKVDTTENPVDEVRLSAENDWTYEWTSLDGHSEWYVLEMDVPKGYEVSYDASVPTDIKVKNSIGSEDGGKTPPVTPSRPPGDGQLIQTGQLHWPVPVLALAGLVLFAAGWILRKRHED